jgi:hypothetical protein
MVGAPARALISMSTAGVCKAGVQLEDGMVDTARCWRSALGQLRGQSLLFSRVGCFLRHHLTSQLAPIGSGPVSQAVGCAGVATHSYRGALFTRGPGSRSNSCGTGWVAGTLQACAPGVVQR